MKFVANLLINPFSWYLILILITAYFLIRKDIRSILRTFILFSIIFLSSTTSFIPEALIKNLEKKSPVLDTERLIKTKGYDILIIGSTSGAMTSDHVLPLHKDLSLNSLLEGVKIHKELPGSILFITDEKDNAGTDHSDVLVKLALDLGSDSVVHLSASQNLFADAIAYSSIRNYSRKLILVTDAIQMPEALASFNASGIFAIPAPTNFIIEQDIRRNSNWLPSARNVIHLHMALKAYMALIFIHFQT